MRWLIPVLGLILAACGAESQESSETPETSQDSGAGATQATTDTHDALAAEVVAVVREQVETLEKVTDEATAKQFRGRIRELGRKLADLKERQRKLGDPDEEKRAALEAKYGEELKRLFQRQGQIGMRFAKDPKIQAALAASGDG